MKALTPHQLQDAQSWKALIGGLARECDATVYSLQRRFADERWGTPELSPFTSSCAPHYPALYTPEEFEARLVAWGAIPAYTWDRPYPLELHLP